jgi:acetyl-CoA acetyltransferase
MEWFTLRSHALAIEAWDSGRFDSQVSPYAKTTRNEGSRSDASADKLAALRTLLPDGNSPRAFPVRSQTRLRHCS